MNPQNTALILIGYQNDYFSQDGALWGVLENQNRTTRVLKRTVNLVERLKDTLTTIISTPIIFSSDYSEVLQADGILRAIKDASAFKVDTHGAETVDEIKAFGDRIIVVPGKRGLNAFIQTELDSILAKNKIKNVIFAGAVTSICIDSTARAAYEFGYRVFILEDCIAARTDTEQEFFCGAVFPTYANISNSKATLDCLSSIRG